jgi:hypothetical protein
MADHEPMTDVACGEPALSDELRAALTLLRDRSEDDEFRTLVDDVLGGRVSLFDASSSAAFGQAVFVPMAQELGERFANMTEEERRAVAAEADVLPGESCTEAHHEAAGCEGEAKGSACAGCPGLCSALGARQSPA